MGYKESWDVEHFVQSRWNRISNVSMFFFTFSHVSKIIHWKSFFYWTFFHFLFYVYGQFQAQFDYLHLQQLLEIFFAWTGHNYFLFCCHYGKDQMGLHVFEEEFILDSTFKSTPAIFQTFPRIAFCLSPDQIHLNRVLNSILQLGIVLKRRETVGQIPYNFLWLNARNSLWSPHHLIYLQRSR